MSDLKFVTYLLLAALLAAIVVHHVAHLVTVSFHVHAVVHTTWGA